MFVLGGPLKCFALVFVTPFFLSIFFYILSPELIVLLPYFDYFALVATDQPVSAFVAWLIFSSTLFTIE